MTSLLVVLGLALAVSALASMLEAALLSIPLSHIARLEEEKERAGSILLRLREDVNEPVTALLTLSTLAQVVGAAMGGAIAVRIFGDGGIALFIGLLTLGVLIFAELVPKMIGARHWRSLALPTAHLLRWLVLLMRPILLPLSLLRLWVGPRGVVMPSVNRAELEAMAEIGRREGTLDEEEWEVVTNVISLDQVAVNEVMTPRTSIVALPIHSSVDEAMDLILEEGHLRIPVYERTLDEIVGVLLARDLWRAGRDGTLAIRELIRSPIFVPASKPVEDLIREMRLQRMKMAIVVDEYGGTAGLVTMEDLVEQIVGDIQDEHEQEPLPFEEEHEGEVRIRGDVPLWEVNERFETELPEDVYDTIGGYVFGELGRIAEIGDEVVSAWGCFRVEMMDGRRIERVSFIREVKPHAGEPA